jgi:hypothetical protein
MHNSGILKPGIFCQSLWIFYQSQLEHLHCFDRAKTLTTSIKRFVAIDQRALLKAAEKAFVEGHLCFGQIYGRSMGFIHTLMNMDRLIASHKKLQGRMDTVERLQRA